MARVFKLRDFDRWMRKTPLTDAALCAAVAEMASGLVDADLGGNVYKKRVALPGGGKSGGVRTLVATRQGELWFFMFGFEKAERSNVTAKELAALKMLAADLLSQPPKALDDLGAKGSLKEICHEG